MKQVKLFVLACLMMAAGVANAQQVIAHRGYWTCEGSAQNSISALKNSAKIGVYGSEFDVHITTDGKVVVFHDDTVQGMRLDGVPYSKLKDIKLKNGERIPLLEEYLATGKTFPKMQLILEIKAHDTKEKEDRCIDEVLKEVKAAGVEKQVEYISFSLHACEQLRKKDPKAVIYYLNGDLNPQQVKDKGFNGIDYDGYVLLKHPEWIEESHKLGMKVNVWTIDKPEDIKTAVMGKVDFITTNQPVIAEKIIKGTYEE